MLMATQLVISIEDFCWILHDLESLSWLTLQLPLDTFDCAHNSHDNSIADGSNVPGPGHGERFTPGADT
jgi:hypothetical protein